MVNEQQDDDYTVREMYAEFGLAVYQIQCVERSLAIYIAFSNTDGRNITRGQYDQIFEEHFSLTLGQLLNSHKDVGESLPVDIITDLDTALEIRNRLIHNYWWENSVRAVSTEGRKEIIDELSKYVEFLGILDDKLSDVYEKKAAKKGVTEKMVSQAWNDLVLSGEPATPQRRLQKKEKITKAYRFDIQNGEQGYIPIFQFGDGTLWTFGDDGLVPAPNRVDLPNDSDSEIMNEILPAYVNPKPKIKKFWSYVLDLSTGARIWVEPVSEMRQGLTYKWRIIKKDHE